MRTRLFAILGLALAALAAPAARAQTQVTGTIVDPSGYPYSGARISFTNSGQTYTNTNQAQCVAAGLGSQPCQMPLTVPAPLTTDAAGNFSVALIPSASISPGTPQWRFNIVEPGVPPPVGTGPQQFSVSITIVGTSQSVSATLSAAAPALTNITGGGGGGTPCVSLALSVQFNNAGAFGCVPMTYTAGATTLAGGASLIESLQNPLVLNPGGTPGVLTTNNCPSTYANFSGETGFGSVDVAGGGNTSRYPLVCYFPTLPTVNGVTSHAVPAVNGLATPTIYGEFPILLSTYPSLMGADAGYWRRFSFAMTQLGTPFANNAGELYYNDGVTGDGAPGESLVVAMRMQFAGTTPVFCLGADHPLPYVDSNDCAALVNGGVFNAVTGYQIGGTAPFNHCLLGDGSHYVDSTSCGGFLNPMTTLGDIIAGGVAGAATRVAGPTGPNGVPQFYVNTPSAGLATAPTTALAGVPISAPPCTSNAYTIAATDRASFLPFADASACAVTVPQAGATAAFGSNFPFATCNSAAGADTFTPATSTVNVFDTNLGTYTSGASSLALTTGRCAFIYSDPSGSGTYWAIVWGALPRTTTSVGNVTVNANTCSGATTVTMTGVTAANTFDFTPSTDISAVVGWGSTGGLAIVAWPTANTLNYKTCNQTGSNITTGASVTFNVSAR